jgi:hypothetical protein
MTGFVLALAGLTCGDGGPGAGAATAAVAESPMPLDGEWEGTARLGRSELCEARYSGGKLTLRWPKGRMGCASPFELRPAGRGRARLTLSGRPLPAILRYEGRRLLVCYGDGKHGPPRSFAPDPNTVLLTLRQAAPRKP